MIRIGCIACSCCSATLALVTMTELFTSSGNNSFSTPADAEWIHFRLVRCGQISCISWHWQLASNHLCHNAVAYCVVHLPAILAYWRHLCPYHTSRGLLPSPILTLTNLRTLAGLYCPRHAHARAKERGRQTAACTFQLHIRPSSA